LGIGVNRNVEFAAKNFQSANVIAVFVGEQNAIELLQRDPALLDSERDLARAQPTIDQNFAMISGDERAITGTAAAEHRQTEHGGI